jgi:hypothetical protein
VDDDGGTAGRNDPVDERVQRRPLLLVESRCRHASCLAPRAVLTELARVDHADAQFDRDRNANGRAHR